MFGNWKSSGGYLSSLYRSTVLVSEFDDLVSANLVAIVKWISSRNLCMVGWSEFLAINTSHFDGLTTINVDLESRALCETSMDYGSLGGIVGDQHIFMEIGE